MSHNKDRESFLEFQETWNLEKVKEMRLDEYTGIGGAAKLLQPNESLGILILFSGQKSLIAVQNLI